MGEYPLYFDQKVKCLTKGSGIWEYGKIRPTHPSKRPTGAEEHHRHIEVDLETGTGIKTFCLTNGDRVIPAPLARSL